MQKTITIDGRKYTAKQILALPAYETKGGDLVNETEFQGNLYFHVFEDFISIKNAGVVKRNTNGFGDSIAQLVR